MKEQMFCEHCGEPINKGKSLELSFKTNKWYKPGECPKEESQGVFIVGSYCAKKLLKESGHE